MQQKSLSRSLAKSFSPTRIRRFQSKVYAYYRSEGRMFAWRKTYHPYRILVSEIMLQQTQTARVEVKYPEFIKKFPNFESLHRASFSEVLKVWQGLGYNRRALALKKIAEIVSVDFNGRLPRDEEILRTLPGIGAYTAASIAAFAFEIPGVFIETNVRAVFIHEFFPRKKVVHDRELLPLVAAALDKKAPREWYYALMDYGVFLKKCNKLLIKRGAAYRKQSVFRGSRRELRGKILRVLSREGAMPSRSIARLTNEKPARIKDAVSALMKEGLVVKARGKYSIAGGAGGL